MRGWHRWEWWNEEWWWLLGWGVGVGLELVAMVWKPYNNYILWVYGYCDLEGISFLDMLI